MKSLRDFRPFASGTATAVAAIALLIGIGASQLLAAASPDLISYQALVFDTDNIPLNGEYTIAFAIYASAAGPDLLWQESHGLLNIQDGQLSVLLGQGSPEVPLTNDVFSTTEAWIGIFVNGQELLPRSRLVSTPYAHRIGTIDEADGGVVKGRVSIMPPAAKSGDAYETSLIVTGDAGDSVIISPGEDIGLRATNDSGDESIQMTAGLSGGTIRVTASDAAKDPLALSRQVVIDPGSEVVLNSVEENGDTTVMITANPSGGAIRVTASDAAKDPLAASRQVLIDPAQDIVLNAVEADGDTSVMITASDVAGGAIRVTASDAAKDGNIVTKSVLINKDGLFILGGDQDQDTTLQLLTDGSIVSLGQISTGDSSSNTGVWATALGYNNAATGDTSAIGGGANNIADSILAVVSGGSLNNAGGYAATIGGGQANTAAGSFSTIAGGKMNNAAGDFSFVSGGYGNSALGRSSVALGSRAKSNHDGSIVIFANSSSSGSDSISSSGPEQLVLRADGGIFITDEDCDIEYDPDKIINTPSGAHVTRGGNWVNASDRNLKENFRPVDAEELLSRLAGLEINQWNYKTESDNAVHIGPTAQDFHDAFGVGNNNKTISTIDPSGVALAAIKALHAKTLLLEERSVEIDDLKRQLADLQELISRLVDEQE